MNDTEISHLRKSGKKTPYFQIKNSSEAIVSTVIPSRVQKLIFAWSLKLYRSFLNENKVLGPWPFHSANKTFQAESTSFCFRYS